MMNILLMGARASGKSTVGRLLADRLNMHFVDLDECALAMFAEPTVQEVWRVHGEQAWRRAEVQALQQVLDRSAQVVALGGGTPTIDSAREMIVQAQSRADAVAIYLRCDAQVLKERLRTQAGDRPSLTGQSPASEIETIAAQREPVYRALANAECDTTHADAARSADDLARIVRSLNPDQR